MYHVILPYYIFQVLGLALGSVGIWIRVDFDTDKYKNVLDPVFRLCEEEDHEFEFTISVHMDTITYFLIFLGVAIMATGCVGVCGTKREKATLMAMVNVFILEKWSEYSKRVKCCLNGYC